MDENERESAPENRDTISEEGAEHNQRKETHEEHVETTEKHEVEESSDDEGDGDSNE